MSDSISAYHDDCNQWLELCRRADIADVDWEVYSDHAKHAEIGYQKKALKGAKLKRYVQQALKLDQIAREQEAEREEFELYLQLKAKYEPNHRENH